MNMPEMDKYYTVQAHTILRQYLDYKHWYDRQKLTLRDIHNCQYVACMNPTAGNFTIDSRIQRHFAVFAVSFPGHVNRHFLRQFCLLDIRSTFRIRYELYTIVSYLSIYQRHITHRLPKLFNVIPHN